MVSEYEDETALLDGLFKGKDIMLRQYYEFIKEKVLQFGKDVDIKPSKTYISFYRTKQFLIIKPTKGNLLLGLAIKNDRLLKADRIGVSERITNQITIKSDKDMDAETVNLLRDAYEMN